MISILFIAAISLLNRLRGSKPYPDKVKWSALDTKDKILKTIANKTACAIYVGILSIFIFNDPIAGAIVALGFRSWSSMGWGKYFSAFNGRYQVKEKEFFLSDWVSDAIYEDTNNGYLAGTIGMALRGLLIAPLFLALSLYFSTPLLLAIGTACGLLQGFAYGIMRHVPETKAVTYAELLYGAIIAASLIISAYVI